MGEALRLRDVRAVFRLIGEIRAIGSDPAQWRTHLVRKLRRLLNAEIVISSEVHVRNIPGQTKSGMIRVVDAGWGCDGTQAWEIHAECNCRPEEFLLSLLSHPSNETDATSPVPVQPLTHFRAGKSFVLSQFMLPHLGTVDQLGVHKDDSQQPFTRADHRLIRLFHLELGRLWRKDALLKACDPRHELPPRLAQTLSALQAGCSEKEVSQRLGISPHTVHNYVKALHRRFDVSSRGELLAKIPASTDGFLPQFIVRR